MPKGQKQGKTTIAQDLIKQKVYIDSQGNEVRGPVPGGFSNEVVKKAEAEAQALDTKAQTTQSIPPVESSKEENPLAQAIKAQVQAAVKDSIKDIDINSMVQQAIKDAFK